MTMEKNKVTSPGDGSSLSTIWRMAGLKLLSSTTFCFRLPDRHGSAGLMVDTSYRLHLNRQSVKSPIQFDKLGGTDRWHPHVEPQEEHCK
ncbi:uncharacterized protein LOC106144224 isoform X2 [Microtus ochrogaster]|uniref:Uncharacterized protein LOC106144224 isoform X2 n=1 Tax=Microtus ochrogaster TaxID=79684 RepID=A0ABM1ULR6_MICOH|nr:uncharacterized protein LOC106144224 isoform X2 [Microtus ochrogaster]